MTWLYLLASIPSLLMIAAYVYGEVRLCRRGYDVYPWTKSLVKFLDSRK